MKGDEIAFEAKKDLLIVHFADSYLKKHKRKRITNACSNRMRELSRVLTSYRKLASDSTFALKDIFHPRNFNMVVSAVRNVCRYNSNKKQYGVPSLAMHLGTFLKTVAEELDHLVETETTGFQFRTSSEKTGCPKNIETFQKLIKTRWAIEVSSIASKNLQEKKWEKPHLVPLVSDVKLFREECLKLANNSVSLFSTKKDDTETYKLLVNCTLALLIVYNRRRIGDVQFLKIKDL